MGARDRARRHRIAHAHAEHRPELNQGTGQRANPRRHLPFALYVLPYTTDDMSHLKRVVVAASVVAASAAVVYAAVPSFWQVATQADFLKGEVENLSIDGHGRLMLGPSSTTVYESSAPFLWTVLPGTDASMYVGSGNEGQVFRIDAAGKGSVFFDAEELEVHALAPAPNGALYVGTSPDGKVYKVDAKGIGATFFDPADKYIWSLAVD